MSDRPSRLGRLHLRPPAVEFIQTRLQRHHAAFVDPPAHYNPASEQYEPKNKAKTLMPRPNDSAAIVKGNSATTPLSAQLPVPPRTMDDNMFPPRPALIDVKAMEYWTKLFKKALEEFNETDEPEDRNKTEYNIRNEDDWYNIYEKLEKARTKYQSETGVVGWLRRVRRKAADHAAPVAQTTSNVKKVLPENSYSTPVLGAVQLILDAASAAAAVRGKVIEGFDGLIPIFSDVEVFLSTFSGDSNIEKKSVELMVATLDAIEHAIGFFISNEFLRGAVALSQGSNYKSTLQKRLEAINEKSQSLIQEALKSHIYESHLSWREMDNAENSSKDSQETMRIGQQLLEGQKTATTCLTDLKNMFEDHIKNKDREIEAAKRQIAILQIECDRLSSVSPGLQGPPVPPQPQPHGLCVQESCINPIMLRQFLSCYDVDITDEAFINNKRAELPAREMARVEQIVSSELFRNWLLSPQSAKLLIHWDGQCPRVIAGVSPLSAFCVSMVQTLRTSDRLVGALWFCGQHIDPSKGPVGGSMMLASFIDQLLRQHAFGVRMDGTDIKGIELWDKKELIGLFVSLVQQVPETATLVFIIDGVILYERDDMEAWDVFLCLVQLVADSSVRAAIKLLLTSTPGTDTVRAAFEEEDLILRVDGLPKLVWAPSADRMARELEGGLTPSD
ncbi:hypothetical protein N0V84_004803 [Fusarium piperis]|uniref:Fungal STAND N-terminal Goodbye domain-containing protein n=1 Tax=Fusarium piperis TaxID=1435070 RepID=A0A9W8WEW6_9HYPO|nr:hypothetical protein N0V84_004803 [Fusarium piperis]